VSYPPGRPMEAREPEDAAKLREFAVYGLALVVAVLSVALFLVFVGVSP
jgi:hypothetical protein